MRDICQKTIYSWITCIREQCKNTNTEYSPYAPIYIQRIPILKGQKWAQKPQNKFGKIYLYKQFYLSYYLFFPFLKKNYISPLFLSLIEIFGYKNSIVKPTFPTSFFLSLNSLHIVSRYNCQINLIFKRILFLVNQFQNS